MTDEDSPARCDHRWVPDDEPYPDNAMVCARCGAKMTAGQPLEPGHPAARGCPGGGGGGRHGGASSH